MTTGSRRRSEKKIDRRGEAVLDGRLLASTALGVESAARLAKVDLEIA